MMTKTNQSLYSLNLVHMLLIKPSSYYKVSGTSCLSRCKLANKKKYGRFKIILKRRAWLKDLKKGIVELLVLRIRFIKYPKLKSNAKLINLSCLISCKIQSDKWSQSKPKFFNLVPMFLVRNKNFRREDFIVKSMPNTPSQ